MEGEALAVAVLELLLNGQINMALHRADPAHLATNDSDWLALDHRFIADFFHIAGFGKGGAARAEFGGLAKLLANGFEFGADLFPLAFVAVEKVGQIGAFLHQRVTLGDQLHLFQAAQGPQAHVENGLGLHFGQLALTRFGRDVILFRRGPHMGLAPVFSHQRALGVGVIADDVDDAIQVQEGDDKPFQHFKPGINLFDPVFGPAPQNLATVVQKGAQDFLKAADLWDLAVDQHVHVQAETAFQIRVAEQRCHQHLGFDRAGSGFQHDADVFGGFVADICQKRHLFQVHKLCQLFDQPRFLHLIGNFGDDDLPHPTA